MKQKRVTFSKMKGKNTFRILCIGLFFLILLRWSIPMTILECGGIDSNPEEIESISISDFSQTDRRRIELIEENNIKSFYQILEKSMCKHTFGTIEGERENKKEGNDYFIVINLQDRKEYCVFISGEILYFVEPRKEMMALLDPEEIKDAIELILNQG